MNCDRLSQYVATAIHLLLVYQNCIPSTCADEWPMRGRDGTRNAVSSEKDPPKLWCIEQSEPDRVIRKASGVRWSGPLGSETYSSPVVASGLVWIGTNSYAPENNNRARNTEWSSVLRCFRESDGQQVYEYLSPWLGNRRYDAGWSGLGSSPLVEGDRLWFTTNRSEVLCMDIGPLLSGQGEPRELWKIDLVEEFGVFPRVPLMGPPRSCSIGASWNERIFVTINHGISYEEVEVADPEAPSLICLNKDTGAILWKDNSPGKNILMTQFASPTLATIDGEVQVIVPQSDGWVRAFDPTDGKLLWEFDINFKASILSEYGNGKGARNTLMAEAVVYDQRVFVASGQYPENGEGPGRLVCIDPTRNGDVSSELAVDANGQPVPRRRKQAIDADNGETAIPNPNSGLVWEFTQCGQDFTERMHRTLGSVAVAQDLVIAADFCGVVHCLDAKTGHRYWGYDMLDAIWTTPLIVDDHVYVADESGEVTIFKLGAEPRHADPIATVDHYSGIYASPTFAGGTLYIPTRYMLYAIEAADANSESKEIGDWPQWRGHERKNLSKDKGLLQVWPEPGPPLDWRVDGLGDGIASLAIADGRIFTTTTYGSSEYAVALDEQTGQRLWATDLGTAVEENILMRWLSQRSPTVDGTRIYVFTNTGWLLCLDANTGWIQWRVSYPHEFGTKQGRWGYCDRPLVDGAKLICTPGGTNATFVALDKFTGKRLWSTLVDYRESAAYASTISIETDGLEQYVAFLENGVVSVAADDGRVLWRDDSISNRTANSYTPHVLEDGLLCAGGYRGGVARLKLVRTENKVHSSVVYQEKLSFDPFEDSAMLVNDYLYAFDSRGMPFCSATRDGKSTWKARGRGKGKAAATYADGNLIVRWSDGTIALIEANPKDYVEKGHFMLDEPRRGIGSTFPVVTGGRLYLRDNDRLYKYDLTQHAEDHVAPEPRLVALSKPKESKRPTPPEGPRVANAIFVPTPSDVVTEMLKVAQVTSDDVVMDLGSGDGRILIEAAKQYGCTAVGIELDPELVALSAEKVRDSNLSALVTIKSADLFEADLSQATVIAAYLPSDHLQRLIPKFEAIKPGSRIVTHQFLIPGMTPETTTRMTSQETGAEHTIYVWSIPLQHEPKKD